MSTAIHAVYDGTVQTTTLQPGAVDPRRRRVGYNPALYRMQMHQLHSGQQQVVIPAGVLLPFRTKDLKAENFNIGVKVEEYVKAEMREFTAEWFIRNVKQEFEEYGFRELGCLTALDDFEREPSTTKKNGDVVLGKIISSTWEKSPHGYFAAVHPSFAEVAHECPYGLSVCLTCRLELLGAPDQNNPDGEAPEWLQERMEALLDPSLGETLRHALIESNEANRQFYVFKWATLVGEIDGRKTGEPGLPALGEAEHHVRMNLHEIAPADRAASVAAGFGAEVGAAQSEGMKEMAAAFREGNQSEATNTLLAKIIERQDKTDDVLAALAKTTQQLAQGVMAKPDSAKK